MKMKTMFKLPQLCGAVFLISCTTSELPPQAEPAKVVTPPATSVITPTPAVDGVAQMYVGYAVSGKTSMTPKGDPTMPSVAQKADMSALRAAGSTAELNYIAIGSSLTAGYRDRGLTRESQLTAYPNLIAHQMGLVNFKSPFFDVAEANGSGGLVFDGTADMPSWKQVTNQTALKSNSPMLMSKYSGGDFQNISSPFLGKDGFGTAFTTDFQNTKAYPFVERLIKPSDIVPSKFVQGASIMTSMYDGMFKKQKMDIYSVEFGFDNYINYIMTQRNLNFEGFMLGSYGATFDVKGNVIGKPIWLLMPSQILRLPYFQFFTYDKLTKMLGVNEIMIGTGNDDFTEKADKNCVFLPTQRILDAIKNKSSLGVVPDVEVMDALECQGARTSKGLYVYNGIIETAAKEKNIPLVDLPAVYEKVLNGQYISEDGFKIDPSFPKGNFFSQDGIYPSAIGQAVIANEVIKVMNKSYNSKIPLINITEFARGLK
jgi:hypothetical protein